MYPYSVSSTVIEKKYESLWPGTDTITERMIREKQYVLYGGLALDRILQYVTEGNMRIYEESSRPDYDIYIDSPAEMELILEYYRQEGLSVRAINAMHVGTKRIIVSNFPEPILDVSIVPNGHPIRYIEFGGMRYIHPDYIKRDYYQQLCMNLITFQDRIVKTFERIRIMEQFFVNSAMPILKESRLYGGGDSELILSDDVLPGIWCGDIVYTLYTTSRWDPAQNMALFTNQVSEEEAAADDIETVPFKGLVTYIYLPEYDRKICTIYGLLYYYYRKKTITELPEDQIEEIDAKINVLLNLVDKQVHRDVDFYIE